MCCAGYRLPKLMAEAGAQAHSRRRGANLKISYSPVPDMRLEGLVEDGQRLWNATRDLKV